MINFKGDNITGLFDRTGSRAFFRTTRWRLSSIESSDVLTRVPAESSPLTQDPASGNENQPSVLTGTFNLKRGGCFSDIWKGWVHNTQPFEAAFDSHRPTPIVKWSQTNIGTVCQLTERNGHNLAWSLSIYFHCFSQKMVVVDGTNPKQSNGEFKKLKWTKK